MHSRGVHRTADQWFTVTVRPRHVSVTVDPFAHDHGWYDIAVTLDQDATYRRRFAGHVENGQPSRTG